MRNLQKVNQKTQTNQENKINNKQLKKSKQEIDQLYEESVKQSQENLKITVKVADKAVQQMEENVKSSNANDHKKGFLTLSKQEKEKRKKINKEIELIKEIFWNAIQNEPLYCKCQQPSFVSMVMCDNQL
ncbi:unnamed protein product (macronuclear) [Paramecium tetraurelia]|uniref:Uncharacterized protein n=1 Tax=Paramecium tetraurelia TaxID=5888 RepID=A0CEI3_PARTE|nr:uncharacterized protein GSPATT00037638001 [Paramecium tetraurelia]CAK69200.1 unnamed protein product [Paramecium tetraurelia]|eukprot:XP_001436597.1 hypothetical protein (macronuclear) [Paramecium tetraurelia strain d4-2]